MPRVADCRRTTKAVVDAGWKDGMGASARLADANKLLAGHVNFRVVPMELREGIAKAIVDKVDTSATGVEAAKQYKQDARAGSGDKIGELR